MKKLFLLLTLITTLGFNTKASHNLGGEITYEYAGGNNYKITLKLYTDCSGLTMPPSMIINASSASCALNQNSSLPFLSARDISQVCDTNLLACNSGTIPGLTETVYEGIISNITPCNDWVFSYGVCCRNGGILNINNPSSYDFYIESTMNNSSGFVSSPIFIDQPRWFIPINQTNFISTATNYNYNDSIHYSLVTPLTSNGSPLTFNSGYSASEPFISTPGTSIDNQTGIITTTPTSAGQSLITVKVDKFINGTLLGSVSRDFTVNVISGMNTLPAITNSTLHFTGCSSDTLEVDIYSFDPTDTVTTELVSTGVSFTNAWPSNEHSDLINDTNSYVQTWHGGSPNYINVRDNQCPIYGVQSYALTTTGTNCAPCIAFDIVTTSPSCPTCNDGTASIINLTGGCPPYAFQWDDPSLQTTQIATGLTFGTYSVVVIDGGCCPGVMQTCCFACDSVWPGDANSDLIANVYDLLPIGVFYNTTETARPGATSNWNAEWSANWSTNQGSSANIKHVDCDGDGTIDINDVNPILLNYNLTHVARWVENNPEGINDPTIYIDIAPDTIPNNTPLSVPIMFGTASLPADSIYGIAMSITYDALVDSIAGVTVDYSNSWLGTEGVDMITLDTNHFSNGQIDIGLVRTDGQMMIGGFGEILTLNVITIDNLSGKTAIYQTLTFDFMNVVIIDNAEEYRAFNQELDSVVIEKITTSVNTIDKENKVHISPNPNNGSFRIYMNDLNDSKIEIINTIGQSVTFTSSKQHNHLKVDINQLQKGFYFVKIKHKNKTITVEKIIVH